MAIFPKLILEDMVQVDDKTRLDATKSFTTQDEDAISLVEIQAETGSGYVEVGAPGTSKDWYLDWSYDTDGDKTVSCRVTVGTGLSAVTETKDFTLTVISIADDNLFSSDADLMGLEHDIMKFLPAGKASYLNVHRKAQKLILSWLDENGHWDNNGDRLTAAAIVDVEEVRSWSAALTMQLIYGSISNDPNDIFSVKMKQYESMAISHRNRSILRLDVTGDATISDGEGVRLKTLDMVRR